MKKQWIIYIMSATLLTACYKDENITGEPAEPRYKVEDSNEPADHFIYEFYRQYNSFILYNYETVDYQWNMSTLLDVNLVRQANKPEINEGLSYLGKVLLNDYSDEFKAKYLPFKILLADSVQTARNGVVSRDDPAEAGLSFMAIGKIRSGISGISPDSLVQLKGNVQGIFWSKFLYDNGILKLPDAYWKISGDYYSLNLRTLDGNENKKPDDIDARNYGFWDRNRGEDSGNTYCMAPSQTLDIFQFIQMITTHTASEIEALIAPYDKLKDKYHLLVNQLKEVYQVDIQAIGNQKQN